MKSVTYDKEKDTLKLRVSDKPVAESDNSRPGIIIDYDKAGNLVGVEIFDASLQVDDPERVQFAITH